MLHDGLFKRFPRPDICLSQHVSPLAAGMVGHNACVIMSGSINVDVRLFGKGGHGSAPHVAVDPVIMVSSLIMKLQTIRSRELAGDVPAVVTIGFVNAGTQHNIIPGEAHIGVNIRTQSTNVQEQIISAIRRMAEAEAQAFRAPKMPDIATSDEMPLTSNSEPIDQRIRAIHTALLGSENIIELPTIMASEDPGRNHFYGEPIPYCVWEFGVHSRERYNAAPGDSLMAKIPYLPSNHQPNFIPDSEPTLRTGVRALTSAALAYLPTIAHH
jgi:hippurate hydrolase